MTGVQTCALPIYANVAVQAYAFSGSYARLSLEMARFCESLAGEREQLFRRMAFNCCISNTDDYERNHGFLAADMPGWYRLSPAYDMVPRRHATRRREHALAIGSDGFVATRRNILSGCASFGLPPARAAAILDEVQACVQSNWRAVLHDEGLDESQLQDWAACFAPLPDST